MSPPENTSPSPKMLQEDQQKRAIAARLRIVGQVELYATESPAPPRGSRVIVDTDKGPEVATVLTYPENPETSTPDSLPAIKRPVTDADEKTVTRNKAVEEEAFSFCKTRIREMNLSMKLISVHLNHSSTHTTFYFSAGQRVDFRALVKALANRLQTRIEMRQIGVRDAAKHLGGTGICGGQLCCSTWLPEFKPISIRMAKDQNLTLNHLKLSGVCGRLRCCLEYEHEFYKKSRQGLPKLNKPVLTPKGKGKVREFNVLQRTVRVQLESGDIEEFDADTLTRPTSPPPNPVEATTNPTKDKNRKRRPDSDQAPNSQKSGKKKSKEQPKQNEKPDKS